VCVCVLMVAVWGEEHTEHPCIPFNSGRHGLLQARRMLHAPCFVHCAVGMKAFRPSPLPAVSQGVICPASLCPTLNPDLLPAGLQHPGGV
jgi:hypothetical protein